MTIALYAFVFTLTYAVTVLLLRQAGDRGRHYAAMQYCRTFEAVPTIPILLSDINAIADRFICPICDNDRMECTCYASGRIN